ncbi:MAG TPA: amidase [Hyphomicrobiaceae bacterium]|nr:amidase [Hyphomicrobiaceae bacterium]
MDTDLALLPVHALAARLQARSISPVDIVDCCLARIQRLDAKLNAFVHVFAAEARAAAEAADKAIRSGHAVGPLHGIPVALKDLIELEGRVTTGGSAAWRERRSGRTATLARKLIGAGMIVIGKTHTVEFAFGGWGTNQHLGTPWNPWDEKTQRTPGGSSSGSGVAVAARLVPCAIGTDTGGSVRVPAAWCGITGLKTTIGRISTYGVLPLTPTLDTPGPMTRSVEDAAVLLQVMQGADARDPRTLSLRDIDPMPTLRRGVKSLRLARMPASERTGVDAEVLAAYDRSLETLAALGAEIVDLSLPRGFRDYGASSGRIMSAEAYALLADIVDNNALSLDEAVRPRIRAGAAISAREYLQALAERERLKAEFGEAMAQVDAVLAPVTLTPALPLEAVDQNTTPAVFTRWGNFLDLCALAVPSGFSESGLPLSLQIVCRGGDEAMALRVGWAWQDATDWHRRVPPLAQSGL